MEYDLIMYLQSLLGGGIKGYITSKPENTPYPAFVVESTEGRGRDIYGNNGKPFDYIHSIQINLISPKFSVLRRLRRQVLDSLDGFSGVLGDYTVVDCRLNEVATTRNINKSYEVVLLFTISTK